MKVTEFESRIAHISRLDVASASEPGRYQFKFGWVTITAGDIAMWSQYPRATFAIYEIRGETPNEYRLGAFDLGTPIGATT
jgi:hypothetical protein